MRYILVFASYSFSTLLLVLTSLSAADAQASELQWDNQYANISWICGDKCGPPVVTQGGSPFGEVIKVSIPSFVKPIHEGYFMAHNERFLDGFPVVQPTPGCGYGWKDQDSDGDGFSDLQEPQHPAGLNGPYIADIPYYGTKPGQVHVSIPIIFKSSQKRTQKDETISDASYERETRTSRLHTVKREFGGELEGAFGLADSGWTFSLGAKGKGSLLSTTTWTIEETEKRKVSNSFKELLVMEEEEVVEIDTTKPAHLNSFLELTNISSPVQHLNLHDIEVGIVSYDENSVKRIWGSRHVNLRGVSAGQHNVNTLEINLTIIQSGVVFDLIQSLAQGHTFVAEVLTSPTLSDINLNDLTPRLIEIVQKTARLQIHYGPPRAGDEELAPGSPHIALRRLYEMNYCLTPYKMLEERIGSNNFEVHDGTVTRINNRSNKHHDVSFGHLTDVEKNEYGKWVMSRECPESTLLGCPVDLHVPLRPDDVVTFYFLTREDFETPVEEIDFVTIDDDIGIIPESMDECPEGRRVTIRMDDEDSNNLNDKRGWIGATRSTSNTRFNLCKVDGRHFRNVAAQATQGYHSRDESYAVVMLDQYCPKDSYRFERYFDNEDSSNDNWTTGQFRSTAQNHQGTRLKFCLFLPFPDTPVVPFPDLGFGYGVFGPSDFFDARGLPDGWIYTDDEDSSNRNVLKIRDDLPPHIVKSIIEPVESECCTDGNTRIRMGKVK